MNIDDSNIKQNIISVALESIRKSSSSSTKNKEVPWWDDKGEKQTQVKPVIRTIFSADY